MQWFKYTFQTLCVENSMPKTAVLGMGPSWGNLGLQGEQWVLLSQEVAAHSQELGSVAHSHETQPFDLGLLASVTAGQLNSHVT